MKNKFILFVLCVGFLCLVAAASGPVDSLIEKQGISPTDVNEISTVDKNALPSGLDISEVQENNVNIQKIDYNQNGISRDLFVISFTNEGLKEILKEKEVSAGYYLTFSGVENLGSYVLMEAGSVTGLSSSVDFSGEGEIAIEVYRNEDLMFISNKILSTGEGFDFDLQSKNLDVFNVGDRISIKVKSSESIKLKEVNSIVKIE